MQIPIESFTRIIAQGFIKVISLSNFISSRWFVKNSRTIYSFVCSVYSIRMRFFPYSFRFAFSVSGHERKKERILERFVIKSKQKGIDVIEADRVSFFSLPLLSLALSLSLPSPVGLEFSTRNCIRENGRYHIRDCIIQSREIYIYALLALSTLYNVNPLLLHFSCLLVFSFSLVLPYPAFLIFGFTCTIVFLQHTL